MKHQDVYKRQLLRRADGAGHAHALIQRGERLFRDLQRAGDSGRMFLDQILIVPRDDAGQKRRFIPVSYTHLVQSFVPGSTLRP